MTGVGTILIVKGDKNNKKGDKNCKRVDQIAKEEIKKVPKFDSLLSTLNSDFWGSGWSRGHMAPAGNNKHSQEQTGLTNKYLKIYIYFV